MLKNPARFLIVRNGFIYALMILAIFLFTNSNTLLHKIDIFLTNFVFITYAKFPRFFACATGFAVPPIINRQKSRHLNRGTHTIVDSFLFFSHFLSAFCLPFCIFFCTSDFVLSRNFVAFPQSNLIDPSA